MTGLPRPTKEATDDHHTRRQPPPTICITSRRTDHLGRQNGPFPLAHIHSCKRDLRARRLGTHALALVRSRPIRAQADDRNRPDPRGLRPRNRNRVTGSPATPRGFSSRLAKSRSRSQSITAPVATKQASERVMNTPSARSFRASARARVEPDSRGDRRLYRPYGRRIDASARELGVPPMIVHHFSAEPGRRTAGSTQARRGPCKLADRRGRSRRSRA
jgi:hypothetical protein